MRFIEYLYLTLMILSLVFLATEFETLKKDGILYPILIATALFGFMYVFRRSQRKQVDKYMDEQMRKLEADEKEEEHND